MAELLTAEVQEGEFIGGYQVFHILGKGPHTTTYHVLSNAAGKEFALRTLALNEKLSPEWLERLEAQTTLIGKLQHPNIENTLSSGRFGDFWICTKDLVHNNGGTPTNLNDFRAQHGGTLSPYQVFHLLKQTLLALEHAHSWKDLYHGAIIHGALKPENILVGAAAHPLPGAPNFEIKLSDFQPYALFNETIARSLLENWLTTTKKAPPLFANKAEVHAREALRRRWDYQPPEKERSIQGDLYSLGVIGWELLFGTPPTAQPSEVTALRPELAPEWDSFFRPLLQNDRNLRTTSAAEALNTLEQLQKDLVGEETIIPTPTPHQKEAPKERMSLTPPGMVYIPKAVFLIGAEEAGSDALPQHEVETAGFYLDRCLVTNAQFERFVRETNYETDAEKKGGAAILIEGEWRIMEGISWKNPTGQPLPEDFPTHPVTQVTYDDAVAYCTWQGRRLPTEQEWEYAARGGQPLARYPWGDAESVAYANVGSEGTSPVMQYGANGYGLYDMAGNVWEWTDSFYEAYPGNCARNPHFGTHYRVVRGGCWLHHLSHCMVSFRNANQAERCYPTIGFRTAADFTES